MLGTPIGAKLAWHCLCYLGPNRLTSVLGLLLVPVKLKIKLASLVVHTLTGAMGMRGSIGTLN